MKQDCLDKLVLSGMIKDYQFRDLNSDGNPCGPEEKKSSYRNTQELKITFPNGSVLTASTFCSGYSENTSLFVEINEDAVFTDNKKPTMIKKSSKEKTSFLDVVLSYLSK